MKNVKKYRVEIEGITPIIWNVMQKELEDEKKDLKKNQLNEWEEENWQRKLEPNDKGKLIMPDRWIKSAMIRACQNSRLIPSYATSKKETFTLYVKSCMVDGVEPVGTVKDIEYYGAYVNAQGNSHIKTKVWKVRPRLSNWKTSFIFTDVFGRMSKKELHELVEYAGHLIGVGDSYALNFGRFDIISIEEVA